MEIGNKSMTGNKFDGFIAVFAGGVSVTTLLSGVNIVLTLLVTLLSLLILVPKAVKAWKEIKSWRKGE